MGWRDQYKVHPVTDVFPMMSDVELDALGKDIKANGLTTSIRVWTGGGSPRSGDKPILIDGRNRLEAMERAGIEHNELTDEQWVRPDPVPFIISLNIRRRHLTKEQQADLIVAAIKASRQDGEVPKRHVKGKAGSEKDPAKFEAVAFAADHGISKRTVERSIAKAGGRKPAAYISEDDDCDTPQDTWRRGLAHRTSEAIELALYEDWTPFVADGELVERAEKAGKAWLDLAAYLRTLVPGARQ
jgi:hypothetical protein